MFVCHQIQMGRLAKVFLTPYTVGTQWQREDLVKTKPAPGGMWHNHETPEPPDAKRKALG